MLLAVKKLQEHTGGCLQELPVGMVGRVLFAVMELAMNLQLGGRAVDVVHVPDAGALAQVVEHAHPPQADYRAAILSHGKPSCEE